MILAPIWFICSLTINIITFVVVNIFITFQSILSKYFRPFPIKGGPIRNKNLIELHPTHHQLITTSNSSETTDKIEISTITDAIEAARSLKRFLVVFAHSELNDRSVAALESLRNQATSMNRLIREKFVFFAYSVLDRDTNMTPGFLTSCRSLPAVAVFKVGSASNPHHNHHQKSSSNAVDLLATLEGTANGSTICLFLERCLSTY